MTRNENILRVTRRLIIMTSAVLALLVAGFGFTLFFQDRFMVSWACFGCGLLGGFISIQQRLKTFARADLELLASSWFQIVLIPVYGGLFALVLYVGFLSQIVTGALFPKFFIAPFHEPPTTADLQAFFGQTYPASGVDLAKLLFWCLVAGFSERFIPQIIGRNPLDGEGKDEAGGKDAG
jgi:hypothetical protein